MKRSTKIISVIVISISMATGATAYATYKQGYGEAHAAFMTSYVSNKLDLTDSQQIELSALSTKLMALKNNLKPQDKPIAQEITALLSADKLDQQQALAIITDRTALINQAAPEVVAAFANFLDGLNTAQKAEVLEFLEKKQQHGDRSWKH
ncbi:MAG: Spy/CpxP family protein refolding chaperone [Oceanospirillaceae bacterium]